MSLQTSEKADVIIIGAGQAGLSAGYFLNKHQLNYLIFDRGEIAESWNSQRWDSLRLDSPNSINILPGENPQTTEDDQFPSAKEFRDKLRSFASQNEIRVKEHHNVIALNKSDETGLFELTTVAGGESKVWYSDKVIIASGIYNEPKIPDLSKNLPPDMMQLHSSQYRNAAQLPAGNVLVVGSGRSGSSIAEELSAAGRKVYLATSKVGRVPRRYRGRDITTWLVASGMLEYKTVDVNDPAIISEPQPLVSGAGERGHTISLQMLSEGGVKLFGRLIGHEDGKYLFANNVVENIRYADQVSANAKNMIDGFIAQSGTSFPDAEFDKADLPDPAGASAETATELNAHNYEITAVIWATGSKGNFSWLHLPVFGPQNKLIHDEGASPVQGLFFLGFPWLRKRKSGVIYGVQEDAAVLVQHILNHS